MAPAGVVVGALAGVAATTDALVMAMADTATAVDTRIAAESPGRQWAVVGSTAAVGSTVVVADTGK